MTTHYSEQKGAVSANTGNNMNGIADAEALSREHVFRTPGVPIANALRKLSRAFHYSVECDRTKWDFAVEISDLDSMGLSHDELRWMIGMQLVEQAREISETQGMGRSFDSPGGFSLSTKSCFVLTATGLQLAADIGDESPQDLRHFSNGEQSRNQERLPPVWDDQRHELRLDGKLVKRFKWRATNQEAILAAFQEECWPPRIDDPLPPIPETDPKRRLSDTIKCLNRKQQDPLVRFSGDGTGQGVLWDLVDRDD